MKILTVLLVLLLIVIGLPIVASVAWAVLAVALPVAFLVIWFLPILIILCSDKTTGVEKLAWILLIVFFSWFAWIFYFLLAPIKPRYDYRRYTRSYYG